MQFHDDFDARFAAAVDPIVAHVLSDDAVRAADLLERRAGPSLVPMLAVAAAVTLGAAAVVAPRLAAPGAVVQPSTATSVDDASLAAVPDVRTADGIALVERTGDGIRLVLAAKVEAFPPGSSYISGTIVECPASTGLTQRYYDFGQVNSVSSPQVTFEGITAVGAFRNDLYLAAITSDPTASTWRVWIGEKGSAGTGGAPDTFAKLPSYGVLSSAGCYYDPN